MATVERNLGITPIQVITLVLLIWLKKKLHLVVKVVHGKEAALITVVLPKILTRIRNTGDRDHLCRKMAGSKCTLTNRCGHSGHRSLLRETLPQPRLSGLLSFIVLCPRARVYFISGYGLSLGLYTSSVSRSQEN